MQAVTFAHVQRERAAVETSIRPAGFLGFFCDTVSAAREGEFRFVLKQTYGYWSVSGPCIELEGFFFSANIDVSPAQSPESWHQMSDQIYNLVYFFCDQLGPYLTLIQLLVLTQHLTLRAVVSC